MTKFLYKRVYFKVKIVTVKMLWVLVTGRDIAFLLSYWRFVHSDNRLKGWYTQVIVLKAGTFYLLREYCQSIVWSRDKKNGMNVMNEMSKNLNHILQKEMMEDYHHSRDQNEESNVIIKQY